jgi:hypothetical protein
MNDYEPISQRQKNMYNKAWLRNVPSKQLQPYLNARPVSTKFQILPVVDTRPPVSIPLIQHTFMTSTVFNPGNNFGPWSGYAGSINNESELRNQIYAMQECPQGYYIPSSKSDLYEYSWLNGSSNNQPFPYLFQNSVSTKQDKILPQNTSNSLFNNATRQQIKEESC